MTANPEPFNISDGLVVRRRLRSTAQSLECTTMHSAVARVSSAAQGPWWRWACPGNRMLLVRKCNWWGQGEDDCIQSPKGLPRRHLRTTGRKSTPRTSTPTHHVYAYSRRAFSVAGLTARNSRPHPVRNPNTTEAVLRRLVKVLLIA